MRDLQPCMVERSWIELLADTVAERHALGVNRESDGPPRFRCMSYSYQVF